MNCLRLKGMLWALYIDTQFIEYFASPEDAKRFAEKMYKGLNYFIKPVSYFGFSPEKGDSI